MMVSRRRARRWARRWEKAKAGVAALGRALRGVAWWVGRTAKGERRRGIGLLILAWSIQVASLVFLAPRLEGLAPQVIAIEPSPTPLPTPQSAEGTLGSESLHQKLDEAIAAIAQGDVAQGLVLIQEVEKGMGGAPQEARNLLAIRLELGKSMAELGIKLKAPRGEGFAERVAEMRVLSDRAWTLAARTEDRVWLEKLAAPIAIYEDSLNGIIHLTPENTAVRELRLLEEAWGEPGRMALVGSDLYLVDGGVLYRSQGITATLESEQPITPTAILRPGDKVEGYPVARLLDAAVSSDGKALFLLDEASNVYGYSLEESRWHVERLAVTAPRGASSKCVALATYGDRLYLLDPALNQVWRHPSDEKRPPNYFKEVDLQAMPENMPIITDTVDIGVDGDVYLVTREGLIRIFAGIPPREQVSSGQRVMLPVPSGSREAPSPLKARWLYLSETRGDIYVVDAEGARVVLLRKGRLKFHKEYLSHLGPLRDAVPAWDKLLILSEGKLLVYPKEGAFYPDAEPSDELGI